MENKREPVDPILIADASACFHFWWDWERKKGLREGKFEPSTDEEREWLTAERAKG
jgi:hypothetical protein